MIWAKIRMKCAKFGMKSRKRYETKRAAYEKNEIGMKCM